MTSTYGPQFSIPNNLPVEFQIPTEPDRYREFIANRERITADLLNNKESANYDLIEFVTGQTWFTVGNNNTKRTGFRQVYNRPALAAGGIDPFAHGISNINTFTRLYGIAVTATPLYRPIPYASATLITNQIEIFADNMFITVINGATAPPITSYIVVAEYLKN